PERDAEDDQPPLPHAVGQQRGEHGDGHADRGDPVAADGRARPGQATQAIDEQREAEDVEDLAEVLVVQERRGQHQSPPSPRGGRLPLNISSMRSVTKKPPTTLIVPKMIAMTRMILLIA